MKTFEGTQSSIREPFVAHTMQKKIIGMTVMNQGLEEGGTVFGVMNFNPLTLIGR